MVSDDVTPKDEELQSSSEPPLPPFSTHVVLRDSTLWKEEANQTMVCEYGECGRIAVFNHEGEKRGRFCIDHKFSNMVMIIPIAAVKTERETNEKTIAIQKRKRKYKKKGQKNITISRQHSDAQLQEGKKKCEQDGCNKWSCFNFDGERMGRFCRAHRVHGMINIEHYRCKLEGCYEIAVFGYKDEQLRKFCLAHKVPEMVNLVENLPKKKKPGRKREPGSKGGPHSNRTCEEDGCKKRPSFNFEWERQARFCLLHRLPKMVNVARKHCEYDGCKAEAVWGVREEGLKRRCLEHREEGMVRLKQMQLCGARGCEKRPVCNHPGLRRARFCTGHAEPGMVKLQGKECLHEGCEEVPEFNFPGQRPAKYCIDHKELGMKFVVMGKGCEVEDCRKVALYNYDHVSTGPRFCTDHRQDQMVDVSPPTCVHQLCNRHASFNMMYERQGKFCQDHKLEGMINLADKRCNRQGCVKLARYNFSGEKRPVKCVSHKEDGMVVLHDKRYPTCEVESCQRQACYGVVKYRSETAQSICAIPECGQFGFYSRANDRFRKFCAHHRLEGMVSNSTGYERGPARFCKEHAEEGMENVLRHGPCGVQGCGKRPVWNFPGKRQGIRCSEHKEPGMKDVTSRRCRFEGGCDRHATCNFPGERGRRFCSLHALPGMVGSRQCRYAGGICENYATCNYPGEKARVMCAHHALPGMVMVSTKKKGKKKRVPDSELTELEV